MNGERVADFRMNNEGADREFRRELENLVRGHIDGCMTSFASCSAGRNTDEEEENGVFTGYGVDQLFRRRRRSDVEGDDLAETSAAARRHSRILSQWVARQAEEKITTIERRNRESELMALAGLHTVSLLDSSFLRESRKSQSVERPLATQASSILRRWRQREVKVGSRDRRGIRRGTADSGSRDARQNQASESNDNEFSKCVHGAFGPVNRGHDLEVGGENGRQSSREHSPDFGGVERERVRHIARGWMTESGIADGSSRLSPSNESQRTEWLGETERERVRLVREWVQMNSQQRDSQASRWEGRESEREESVTDHEESQPEHIQRDLLRLRGRQARLDLIMRIGRERERELQGLSEHRAVSDFAHRSRIQSFLRGRFLRNRRPQEYERLSVEARELGQLMQQHPVSGLREGFHFLLEDIVRGQASVQTEGSDNGPVSTNDQNYDEQLNDRIDFARLNQEQLQSATENYDIHQTVEMHSTAEVGSLGTAGNMELRPFISEGDNWQEENAQPMAADRQQSADAELSAWHNGSGEESDGNWHDQIEQEWPAETPEDEGGEGHVLEARDWHEYESPETTENWENGPSDPPREPWSIPARRVNRFIPPDDDNVYSMELRELLSRRSVSTLLRSGFRESLDQLIQSYVQRQGHTLLDWDVQRPLSTPALPQRDQGQQRDAPNQESQVPVSRPSIVLQSPPVPSPQQMWHSGLHHNNWNGHGMHRSEIEWDVINDLRAEIARLQQGMSHMQRMFEACMDMQLELQRSVRQEVSAALNRYSSGQGTSKEPADDSSSKFSLVRKGTCCVCCDNHIDSLLYRCGHMCTCLKCANELAGDGRKCPLCRAPIVEVVRAYSIF